jgi:molybdopterin converting factor subunit 1
MKIKVLFFARLKEIIGREMVELDLNPMLTVADVWHALRTEYPQVKDFEKSLLFSVNQEFADLRTRIEEGDELAIFPPVSGGQSLADKTNPEDETGDVYRIVREPIRLESLVSQLSRPKDGAVVIFAGIVRNNTRGRQTLYLEYEGYEPMALRKMKEIGDSLKQRWGIDRVGMIHRLGRLAIGEASVVIVVSSAHRHVAFEAARYAIDTLKKIVPIWKREFFEDGDVWVEGDFSQVPTR